MKKRILSLFLALIMILGVLPVTSLAAPTLEEAMAEVDVYARNETLNWLTMNGSVKEQHYTYYNYESPQTGQLKEIPAYCVDPRLYGVPALVPEGTAIKYSAPDTVSDPKVCGIIANGYPHMSLETLGLQSVEEAYYATKTALWIYLLANWSINGLGINPNCGDQAAARRVLQAARDIYNRGMNWSSIPTPRLTAVADRDTAYPVTINGQPCFQQIITVTSETWSVEDVKLSLAGGAPAGAKILDMDNREITQLEMTTFSDEDGHQGRCKIVYPASSVEGQTGTVQLNMKDTVVQYAIYYARTLQTDRYGDIQDYMLDTDPWLPISGSFISRYSDDPDDPPPPGTGLKIIKRETGTLTPLEGAVFKVTGPDGSTVGTFSTQRDGTFSIALTQTGHYTVEELLPPKWHLISGSAIQHVQVVHGKVAEVTFYNDPYGGLRVEKYSDTGYGLKGVTFQIRHIATGETKSGRTGSGGVVQFTGLKPGGWEVRETAGIEGWIADTDTVQTVSVVCGETSTVTFSNRERPGLRIIKYDRKKMETLSGVTFAAYCDGEFLGNFSTDALGEILITNAQPGTYRVFEVDTGNDGLILDATPQEVELRAGDGIKELVFFNDTKPGLRLVKVDSANLSKPIPNVKFSIRAVDGSFGPKEFTTDVNGEIDLSKLLPGAYEVTELKCPGYVIDDAQRIIHLDPNEDAEFVFTNSKYPDLLLKKFSSDGTPLAGVSFRLAKIEDGSHYLDRATNTDGEILWEGLEPGVYSLRETATTADHILDPREYYVELFPGKTSTLVIENQKRPNLVIEKRDKDTGKPVPGVTFTLRGADGPTITTEPTDRDGKVYISNLLPGPYTITEQNVPENYILDTTPQTVTLFPNRTATVQFQNYQRPTLKIYKVDINGRFLTGAIFEVKTKAGVKIGDFPVGPDGSITVSNVQLEEGYYIIAEKQAPEGYILDPTPHEVYLRPGRTTEVSIENEKKPGLTIYKVDSVVGDGIKGAKFKIYVSKDKTEKGAYQELDSTFYYTDANGIIHLDSLDTGWYKIVEVEPAAGFTIKEPAEQVIYMEHDKLAEATFENTPLNALVVEKYDNVTHAALPGCTFQLRYLAGTSGTGGTVIGQKVTGKNGTAMWTGLKPGTYIIEEIDPADGYSIINSSETVFIADSGEQSVVTVRFTNAPDGSLLVRKVCSVNPSVTLQDAEFKIMYSDGTLIGEGNGIYRTDEHGEIRVDGLKPGKTVIVTETKAPAGFIIDSQSQSIQIKEGRTMTLTFKNQPRGAIIIQKRDSATGLPLSGAEFRVTTAAGCEVGLDGVIGTATMTQNGLFTTDSNGEIRISNLAPGAYVLTETKAPAGYIMDSPGTNVVIGPNGDTQTVIITNTRKGGLIVEKYDSVTKQPLYGAQFRVTTASGEPVPDNEGLTSSNGLYTTNREGQIVLSKLLPGTYLVSETKAPDNYQIDPTPQTVVVNAGDTQTLRFYDDPLCTLTLLKRDAVTKKPLQGAEFLVRDSSGRVIGPDNGLYTTGSDGTVTVTGLAPNSTVTVSEKKAPAGYILDETPKSIVVRTGVSNSLIFDNEPGTTLIIRKFIEGTENEPLSGVAFKVVDGSGAAVGPDDGTYYTDKAGEIVLEGIEPGTTVIAREIKTVDGFVLDTTPQSILIKQGAAQALTFFNKVEGGLELIKVSESDKSQRIPNTTFEIRKMDGALVDTVTTDNTGRAHLNLNAGDYYAVEIEAAQGFKLDSNPTYFTIQDGKTTTVTVTNKALSGILIHKIDSATKQGIHGVTFLLHDANKNPIGQYSSDDRGYVCIEDLPGGGRYYLRELENEGYIVDAQLKTVYVTPGTTTEITWENTAITGQIQITKTSADYNSMNGWPAGTPIPGTEFEIYHYRTGNLVDTVRTDKNGIAVSKPLPLGRYKVVESKAADFYGLDKTPIDVEIEHAGQIVKAAMTNKALYTNVSIKKTGFVEVMPGQQIRYDFSGIANNSTTALTSFYWRDTLPTQAVRLDKIVTGTYNVQGNYKIVFKTNLNGEYRTMYDNLSTMQNYVLDASPAALGLASNEYVTEFMVSFGVVPANFRQVEAPKVYCNVVSWLTGGAQFVNQADIGGVHNGQWIMATSRWVTKVYAPAKTLPRTGY